MLPENALCVQPPQCCDFMLGILYLDYLVTVTSDGKPKMHLGALSKLQTAESITQTMVAGILG